MQYAKGKHAKYRRYHLYTYLSVLVVPLIISSLLYFFSMRTVTNQSIAIQLSAQRNITASMDVYMQQSQELALKAYFDEDISMLGRVDAGDLSRRDVVRLLNAKKKVSAYVSQQRYNEQFFVVFMNNGVLFSNTEVLTKLRFWYENFFKLEGVTYAQWYQFLNSCDQATAFPVADMELNGRKVRMLQYYFPLGSTSNADKSVAIFLFDEALLKRSLTINPALEASSYIFDTHYTMLYGQSALFSPELLARLQASGGLQGAFTHGDSIIVYSTSNINGWTYASLLSRQVILGDVQEFRNLLVALASLTVITGILLVLYSFRKVAHPIEMALLLINKEMDGSGGHRDALDALVSGVGQIISHNDRLKANLDRQNEQLQVLYIERILAGNLDEDAMDAAGFTEDLAVFLNPEALFAVVVLKATQPRNAQTVISTLSVLCSTLMDQEQGKDVACHAHTFKNDELVLIFAGQQEADIRQKILWLCNTLVANRHPEDRSFEIGIGRLCRYLKDIRQSYRQAKYALAYLAVEKVPGFVSWAEEVPQNTQRFIYPLGTELALADAIKGQRKQAARELFEQVYHDNFIANHLTEEMQRLLLYNIYCTYIKCVSQVQLLEEQDLLEFVRSAENVGCEQRYKVLRDRILSSFHDGTAGRDEDSRIHKMIEYIHANYANCNLDVSTMAGEFGLSENYFSQYFKEQCGEKFGEYLEKYRILQANLLLSEKDLSIGQVAQRVGYTNVNTFRRAFKRVMGVIPTVFRENM